NAMPVSEYISYTRINGFRAYTINDTSLILVNKRSGNPYSGYIRTYHRDRYNLQGEFEDGKMFRLRFWHPNRVLGMDAKISEKSISLWNEAGVLGVSGNEKETYYYYPGGQSIKEIISDTMRSYFNKEGDLERYTIIRDTATINYTGDGKMTSLYPFVRGKGLDGVVKQWHPNGQLKVTGRYKNGRQTGTWIEYDSLGNEINRESFSE
ncbi:MAG: hypothetical protein WD022_09985, partial [Balneolaceae bacterium]